MRISLTQKHTSFTYLVPGILVLIHVLFDQVILLLSYSELFDSLAGLRQIILYPTYYILLILVSLKVSRIDKSNFKLVAPKYYLKGIGVLFLFMILGAIANKLIEAHLFEHWLLRTRPTLPQFEHLILAVICAPFLEEIFYRGIFTSALVKSGVYTNGLIILFGALFFAIIHTGTGIVFNFFTGIAFTWLYLKSRNLTVTIFAHAFQNLFYHLINY